MNASLPSLGLSLAIGLIGFGLGLAWRDCLLPAGAAVLAVRMLLIELNRGAPWPAWHAALRCWAAGALGLLCAAALVLRVAGGALGWWPLRHDAPVATLALLAVAGLWCTLRGRGADSLAEALLWSALLAAAAIATLTWRLGFGSASCALVLVIAGAQARHGWRLARYRATALLRAGAQR